MTMRETLLPFCDVSFFASSDLRNAIPKAVRTLAHHTAGYVSWLIKDFL